MISVKVEKDVATGDITVTAKITRKDLMEIKLDGLDRMTIESPEENAADIFQSLEILARRQLQQAQEIVE